MAHETEINGHIPSGTILIAGQAASASAKKAQPAQNGKSHHVPMPGERIICKASFDHADHVAQIVDTRVSDNVREVFVHYDNWDKRLDEWVQINEVNEYSEQAAAELAGYAGHDAHWEGHLVGRPSRRKVRRLETAPSGALDIPDPKVVANKDADDEHKAHPLKAKYNEIIEFGPYELKTWYYSPYPDPVDKLERIYICEYTMKYFRKRKSALLHEAALRREDRHPPGDEIYTSPPPSAEWPLSTRENPRITAACDPQIVVWEVDGNKAKLYCQNLCLMSKLFLDGKTLLWEVHEFMFYVLCERDDTGDHFVGYFSREKGNEFHHLACILTMPHKQRRGYGGFIIDLSYELARKLGRCGTPERPFSDLGYSAFLEYWQRTLIGKMQHWGKTPLSTAELAEMTGICADDIIEVIGRESIFGQHKLLQYVRGVYNVLTHDSALLQKIYASLVDKKQKLVVDPVRLVWNHPPPKKPRYVG